MVAARAHSDRSEGGKMKAVRTHDYQIEGYGTVTFIKVDLGSGHSSFKVFWRKARDENGTRIAWMEEGQKPSAKLAVFYCKMACAKGTISTRTITKTKA
jgi:hypothetical protein